MTTGLYTIYEEPDVKNGFDAPGQENFLNPCILASGHFIYIPGFGYCIMGQLRSINKTKKILSLY